MKGKVFDRPCVKEMVACVGAAWGHVFGVWRNLWVGRLQEGQTGAEGKIRCKAPAETEPIAARSEGIRECTRVGDVRH